jgi:predicted small secreted protein
MKSVSTPAQAHLRKLVLAFAVASLSAAALTACNTVEGAGEDIESTGDAIQEGVDE